jgi:glycosyltransferase involved in cell wall biosynthesis
MTILINAANVRFGGGVTVAKNIIKSIIDDNEYKKIFLLLPQQAGYNFEEEQNVSVEYVPDKFHKDYFYKAAFVKKGFSALVDRLQPDIVFSLGNVAFPCRRPHLLLIQNAYLFYPESVLWKRLPFKFKLYIRMANLQTRYYLNKADHYMVQTSVMKERLHRLFKVSPDIIDVLPNVVSYQSKHINRNHPVLPLKSGKTIRLLFLSKYYAHKNYDILLPLAREIKKANKALSISLTLQPSDHPFLAKLATQLQEEGLEHIIRFIGGVAPEQIDEAFINHDGVFLPSLLESFSGTYIESMFYGRPVFTSDLDFAHVVCKEAAYYFDPMNAPNVLQTITEAYENTGDMADRIEKGYGLIAAMPGWQDLSTAISAAVAQMLTHKKN